MRVKDSFEIQEKYQTGNACGLVVALETLLSKGPACLAGRTAQIPTPSGKVLRTSIDHAKEHGPVNSVFFRNLGREDVPVGCEITILLESDSERKESSLAS